MGNSPSIIGMQKMKGIDLEGNEAPTLEIERFF